MGYKRSLNFLVLLCFLLGILNISSPILAQGQFITDEINHSQPKIETFYGTVSDGEVLNLRCGSNWSACRNAPSGNARWEGLTVGTVGSSVDATGYTIQRVFYFFDTSAIPLDSKITSATLHIYAGQWQTGNKTIHVVKSTAAIPLTVNDFSKVEYVSGGLVSPSSNNTWISIPLNTNALTWIVKGGLTKLALIHDLDLNNIEPTISNNVLVGLAEESQYRPYLALSYTPQDLPVILVHGWRGAPPQITGCTNDKYLPTSLSDAKSYFQGLGDKLIADGGYIDSEIFYAQLISNPCYTPSIEDNVPYLIATINAAKAATGKNKIILIAHSMGGLVARAYIEGPKYQDDVETLITLGSPHNGTPPASLSFLANGATLGNWCKNIQIAACEFSELGMYFFNKAHHKNNDVTYHVISGNAPFLSRNRLGMAMDALIPGPDDGIVSTNSGRAANLGTFDRWTTDETHGPGNTFGLRTYFIRDGGVSTSYTQCIKKLLIDGVSNCGSVGSASIEPVDNPINLTQHSSIEYGTLLSGESATRSIPFEGGTILFTSQWQNGELAFTLIDPNGQTINPAFAASNPTIVTYSFDENGAAYYFPNGINGTWQMILDPVNVSTQAQFSTFAAFDSNINLSGGTDKEWYLPGETATILATVSGVPSSVSVTAKIHKADDTTDNIPLISIGNGQYQSSYITPTTSGYVELKLTAIGTTASSQPFERETTSVFQVSPNTFTLNNTYTDIPSLQPNSSFYLSLIITVGINATTSGQAGLSADLLDANGNFVAHSLAMQTVVAGTNNLTLLFKGSDIFISKHNGPFTLTNILLTDQSGATMVTQQSQTVYNTAPYLYTSFATSNSFADVTLSHWAYHYIERLYNSGITGGCATNPLSYCPTSPVTRAQMAVFLLKGIHGSSFAPTAVGGSTGFTDVDVTHWAAAWIKQLAAEAITGGCGSGIYCPENTVTRAQMAVFLLKAMYGSSYSPPNVSATFGDTSGHWAEDWIEQLATEGITSGCGNGNYCPENPVTRDQMAVFLVKAFNLP